MNKVFKLILFISLCVWLPVAAQNPKKDSMVNRKTKIILGCTGSTFNSRTPLVFINDKKLDMGSISQFYFPDELLSVTVMKGAGAVKMYGEEARDGVIVYTTKKPVEWITSEEILQSKSVNTVCKPDKLIARTKQNLMKNDSIQYDKGKIAYFDKKFIKEISILNINGNCMVVVKLKE